MRLRARIALLTLFFIGIGALAACGASHSATAMAQKPLSASSRSATSSPRATASASPSPRRLPASPALQIVGEPGRPKAKDGVKAKGAVLADAATGQILWARAATTERPKGPGHHQYWWDNTDDLIGSYQGALGIKDGYTDDAGHCLLFEATRNGRTLIGVVLGSPPTGTAAGAQDAARMLNWGFGLHSAG